MSHVLTVHTDSDTLQKVLEQLLSLGEFDYEVVSEEEATVTEPSWETLTADDYRAMIRAQTPTIKAKSFRNYEG